MSDEGDNNFVRYIYRGAEDEHIPEDATYVIMGEDVTVVRRRAFYRHDNIVEVICHDRVETIEEAHETIAAIKKAIDGKVRGTLSPMSNNYMSKEIMEIFKNNDSGECAAAIIATSFGAKVLGNFFIKLLGKSTRKKQAKIYDIKNAIYLFTKHSGVPCTFEQAEQIYK